MGEEPLATRWFMDGELSEEYRSHEGVSSLLAVEMTWRLGSGRYTGMSSGRYRRFKALGKLGIAPLTIIGRNLSSLLLVAVELLKSGIATGWPSHRRLGIEEVRDATRHLLFDVCVLLVVAIFANQFY